MRVCGGASWSPGFPEVFLLTLFSACSGGAGLVFSRPWPEKYDLREGASRWTGRKGHGVDWVESWPPAAVAKRQGRPYRMLRATSLLRAGRERFVCNLRCQLRDCRSISNDGLPSTGAPPTPHLAQIARPSWACHPCERMLYGDGVQLIQGGRVSRLRKPPHWACLLECVQHDAAAIQALRDAAGRRWRAAGDRS